MRDVPEIKRIFVERSHDESWMRRCVAGAGVCEGRSEAENGRHLSGVSAISDFSGMGHSSQLVHLVVFLSLPPCQTQFQLTKFERSVGYVMHLCWSTVPTIFELEQLCHE